MGDRIETDANDRFNAKKIVLWTVGILVGVAAGQLVFGGSLTRGLVAAVGAIVILTALAIIRNKTSE